jgi:hypothetical protein
LLRLVEAKGRDFNAVNVATCLNRSVVGARQGVVGGTAVTEGLPCCVDRLSRFAGAEHRAVGADPRFLQLLEVVALMLKSRPKELDAQGIANMLNGGCSVSHLLIKPDYLASM